jgi:hypothetical protein
MKPSRERATSKKDHLPPRLKPHEFSTSDGTAEAVPLQSTIFQLQIPRFAQDDNSKAAAKLQ